MAGEALGLALAALMGVSLGLLGGGGSVLAVPIFVYVLGYGVKEAIAMSLAVVGATSLFAAVGHWRRGDVSLRVALVFGTVAMMGTYLGVRLAAFFGGAAQLTLFAAVMLLAAFFMLRDGAVPEEVPGRRGMRLALLVPEGLAVGVLTGLVGVGGGFLIVPALVLLGRIPMRTAVGTSLLVIAMNSASGFAGYLGQAEIPWGFMTAFALAAMAGSLGGAAVAGLLPQKTLRKGFAGFLILAGAPILLENIYQSGVLN